MSRPSRRSRGTVTIDDVAREAGVSAMTVSRVVNREKNVRDRTRDKVLEAIERLNYTPNAAARNLAAGEATHVGLLYSNPSAAYLSQFLVGVLEGARKAGCHLVIEACESEAADEQAEATRRFASTNVEGVILPPPLSESQAVLSELAAAGMPVVTVAKGMGQVEVPLNVRIDDYEAAREITEHLIGLGHRRIGFVKGHPNQVASHERERGFKAALEANGIDPAAAPVEQGYFTFRSGLIAAERLLAREEQPTAIFASNDDMAAAVVSVAHRHRLDVPKDISVVGFDDTALATTVWPELTTVKQPVAEMAEAALELLLGHLRQLRSGSAPDIAERVLEHELILRESTASPAARATAAPPAKRRRSGPSRRHSTGGAKTVTATK